jgi:uncharacterized lipoprotein YddW (UPF0748 family)
MKHPARLIVMLASAAFPALAQAQATPEVRGTWITTSNLSLSTSTVQTPAATTLNFKRLRNVGLNTLYIDVFRNGNTYFNSPSLQAVTGNLRAPELGTRDFLRETVTQAKRNQMVPFAWFQYGLMAKFGNPGTSSTELAKYMADRGWLLQDINNAYTTTGQQFSWMNPLVPQVRTLIKNIALEAVANYDIKGIQWDDHLAWPKDFGYDTYTRNVYLAETGQTVPTSQTGAAWTNFINWRAGKITAFAQELITEVRRVRPGIIISVSPSIYDFSLRNFCVDWPTWVNNGMFDEFVPQVYRSGTSAFNTTWNGNGGSDPGQPFWMGSRVGDLVGGVAINTGSNTPTIVGSQINTVRATTGSAGHSIWFSEGILNPTGNEAGFTNFYNVAGVGHAARPDFPLANLPLPVVGTSVGTNTWQFTVVNSGFYDLIYGLNNAWLTQSTHILGPGTYTFTTPNANQAELLFIQTARLIPEPALLPALAPMGVLLLRRRK